MICGHCEMEIKDPKTAWSRSGFHWCGKTCYFEDWHWLQHMKATGQIPKKRKHGKGVQGAQVGC
jgi:hypothetical protein